MSTQNLRARGPLLATAGGVLAANWQWMLVLAVIPLMATKTLFNVPVVLLGAGGLVMLARGRGALLGAPAVRLLLALFLCIWIPMLTALPDAVNRERSLLTALSFLRFPFAGLFVLAALATAPARRRLLMGVLTIALIWSLDALLQAVTGMDVFGYPPIGSKLSGMFYPNLTMGLVLGVLTPLCLEAVRLLAQKRRWAWLLAVPFAVAVLLSGNRNAWFMFALGFTAYLGYLLYARGWRPRPRELLLPLVAFALLATVAVWQFPSIVHRFQATEALFSTNFAQADRATSYRLSIWVTAVRVIESHWLNGVGPRGFRYVYAQYAGPHNFWMQDGRSGVTHPHQFMLEIAADTGLLGVAGYVLFIVIGLRSLLRLPRDRRAPAFPFFTAAAVAFFPLDNHMAFYASYWSTIAWWLLLCYLAMQQGPGIESTDRTSRSL